MSKHKCQVCDGPIVNGRCAWCGMPYRNDEILYHLNESRSDHYRHATDKAREELRESQIPLGDKQSGKEKVREGVKKSQLQKPVPGQKTVYGKSMPDRAEYAPGKNKYKTPTVGHYTAGSTRRSDRTGSYSEKKKSGTGLVLAIIIGICALLPTFIEYVKYNYSYELSTIFHQNVDTDNLQAYYVLGKSDGELLVEEWFPEGKYVVEIDGGYATLTLKRGDSTKRYQLTEEDRQTGVKLKHGDIISLRNVDTENRYAVIYLADKS